MYSLVPGPTFLMPVWHPMQDPPGHKCSMHASNIGILCMETQAIQILPSVILYVVSMHRTHTIGLSDTRREQWP